MYDDPNSMWCAWKNIFSNVIDRHAPLRTKRVRSSKSPWITSHLKLRMHERDILKIKASRSNDPSDWTIFKKCRNSVNNVNNEIKQAKEIYYIRMPFMRTKVTPARHGVLLTNLLRENQITCS